MIYFLIVVIIAAAIISILLYGLRRMLSLWSVETRVAETIWIVVLIIVAVVFLLWVVNNIPAELGVRRLP